MRKKRKFTTRGDNNSTFDKNDFFVPSKTVFMLSECIECVAVYIISQHERAGVLMQSIGFSSEIRKSTLLTL